MIKHLIFCLLLIFGSVSLLMGQNELTIKLLDAATGKALPSAHVCLENKEANMRDFKLTDLDGISKSEIFGETVIAVSVLGYQTIVDTVYHGGELTLQMTPVIFDMDEVVVTAQINPLKADNSIYKVSVINSLNIQQRAATNLSTALQGELGFRISQDVLGSKLSLNGLGGEHLKILIDGVPVIGRMAGNIDLSQINLNNVDHIEIVEGPMSVIYGSNALGGAINIITKENLRDEFQANIQNYYESVGVYNADAGMSFNSKSHAAGLTAGRNFFSGYPKNDDSRFRLWKPKEQYYSDLYYIYRRDRTKLKLEGKYFYETIQDKGELREPYRETAFDNYFYTKRLTSKLNYIYNINERSKIEISNAYNYYSRLKNNYFIDLTTLEKQLTPGPGNQDTTLFNNLMSRASYAFQNETGRLGFLGGYDIHYETGEGKRILDDMQTIGDFAAFISFNYKPFKSLELQPGFRYAYNTKYDAPFVPSLNVKYDLTESLSFRASYVRGFRAPSLKELYLYFVDINHNIQPGPDLEAEYSHNFNSFINYNFDIDKHYFSLELSTFYNSIENKIDLAITDTVYNVYSYLNIDGYKTMGGNLKIKYRLHPRFNLTMGLGATNHAVYKTLENSELEDNASSYDFMLNLNYNLFRKDFSWGIFYKYSGRYPQFEVFDDEILFGSVDPYHMLDFTINKTFLNKSLHFSTGVKNILDVTTVSRTGSSGGVHSGGGNSSPIGWGRTFFVSFNYKFVKY
jgi:outer membrane receptor for ferrienterochelin and colicins